MDSSNQPCEVNINIGKLQELRREIEDSLKNMDFYDFSELRDKTKDNVSLTKTIIELNFFAIFLT